MPFPPHVLEPHEPGEAGRSRSSRTAGQIAERAARTAELRALGNRERIRRDLLARDGYACQLCDVALGSATPHIDHVIPRARGGVTELHNLQLAHADCNMEKGAHEIPT